MSKDPFKDNISNYLQSVADKDNLFAVTLKKPNKSIDECINYIYAEVKKTGRCGFENDEIYQMAVHYYDEDDIKVTGSIVKPLVKEVSDNVKVDIQQIKEQSIKNSTAPKPVASVPVVSSTKNKKSKSKQSFSQPSLFD